MFRRGDGQAAPPHAQAAGRKAVDLVEVFQADVLRQEVPDRFDGRVGRTLALQLPPSVRKDHLGVEVLAALVQVETVDARSLSKAASSL